MDLREEKTAEDRHRSDGEPEGCNSSLVGRAVLVVMSRKDDDPRHAVREDCKRNILRLVEILRQFSNFIREKPTQARQETIVGKAECGDW